MHPTVPQNAWPLETPIDDDTPRRSEGRRRRFLLPGVLGSGTDSDASAAVGAGVVLGSDIETSTTAARGRGSWR